MNGREDDAGIPPMVPDEPDLYIEPPTIPPGMTIQDYRYARPVRGRRRTSAWRWRRRRS